MPLPWVEAETPRSARAGSRDSGSFASRAPRTY
jgi:hypothetical protein